MGGEGDGDRLGAMLVIGDGVGVGVGDGEVSWKNAKYAPTDTIAITIITTIAYIVDDIRIFICIDKNIDNLVWVVQYRYLKLKKHMVLLGFVVISDIV